MSPQYSEMGENLPGNGPGSAEANNAHHYEGLGDTGSIVIVLLLSSALSSALASGARYRCRCRRPRLQEHIATACGHCFLSRHSMPPRLPDHVLRAWCRANPRPWPWRGANVPPIRTGGRPEGADAEGDGRAQEGRQRIRVESGQHRQATRIQSCSLAVVEVVRARLGDYYRARLCVDGKQ